MIGKSASKVDALVHCPASHVLPSNSSYSEVASAGTDGHDLITGVINRRIGGVAALFAGYPDLVEGIPLILDGIENPRAEAAFVVDVDKRTSVFLGTEVDRKYAEKLGRPLHDHEIGASLDVDGLRNGQPWLRDWKFGITSSWWQLYVQCMALLWLPDCPYSEVDAGFVYLDTHTKEGSVFVTYDTATVYAMDLDERAEDIATAIASAGVMEKGIADGLFTMEQLATSEGSWCKYCPAYPSCPAKWKLAKSMMGLDIVGHVGALTLEDCGKAWKKLAEIEKNIISTTKEALRERMLKEGGFPLENGKKLALIQMPGRASIDKPAVTALLREKGVTQEEINGLFKQGMPYDQVREVKP